MSQPEHLTDAERGDGWTALYLATVVEGDAQRVVRVLSRRADEETYGRAWMVRVEAPEVRDPLPLAHRSEWEVALHVVLGECARWRWSLVSLARAPTATEWVPWPTSSGWWARSTPHEPAPHPVQACGTEAIGFVVYAIGEVESFIQEPHEGWLFTPLGPLPEAPRR